MVLRDVNQVSSTGTGGHKYYLLTLYLNNRSGLWLAVLNQSIRGLNHIYLRDDSIKPPGSEFVNLIYSGSPPSISSMTTGHTQRNTAGATVVHISSI